MCDYSLAFVPRARGDPLWKRPSRIIIRTPFCACFHVPILTYIIILYALFCVVGQNWKKEHLSQNDPAGSALAGGLCLRSAGALRAIRNERFFLLHGRHCQNTSGISSVCVAGVSAAAWFFKNKTSAELELRLPTSRASYST